MFSHVMWTYIFPSYFPVALKFSRTEERGPGSLLLLCIVKLHPLILPKPNSTLGHKWTALPGTCKACAHIAGISAFMLSPIAMKLFCLHNFSWLQQAYLSILSNLPVFGFIESWRITRAVSRTRKRKKIMILWVVCDQIWSACWCLPKIEMLW